MDYIAEPLRSLAVPIAELHEDPSNARKGHAVERIAASLKQYGQRKPIVVNRAQGGKVEAGNGTLAAAKSLGWTHIAAVFVDDDAATAAAYGVADNRVGEFSEWDADILGDLIPTLDGLFTGFLPKELDAILPQQHTEGDTEPQVDRAAELRQKWDVESGQMWQLGDHRIICGDCTDAEVVARVMGGEKAALCFTSPPYAEQRKQQYGGTPEGEYWKWFDGVQAAIVAAIRDDGIFVLNIKPHAHDYQRSLYVIELVCQMVRERGWLLVDEFCWLRTGIPQQVVHRFKNAFEPCYWFARSPKYRWYPESVMHESDSVPVALGVGAGDTNAAKRQGRGGGAIQGNRIVAGKAYPSNVLDYRQNAEALGHPAAFPVRLPSFFVTCMSASDDTVYEPFSGSGTTIIACENLGRRCRAVEISAGYVAVAIERWATHTGGTPELIP